jgi:hypothetical protein
VGAFEHTPQHLYDVDDPCFGFDESSWSSSGGGDWGNYDCGANCQGNTSRGRGLLPQHPPGAT